MPIEVKNFNYKITLVLLFFILNSYLVLSLIPTYAENPPSEPSVFITL